MEYRKKLRKRLYYAISYLVLGLILNTVAFVTETGNPFLSAFGSGLFIIGIVRILRHIRLVKSNAAVKKQEIAETDERNLMLAEKARGWAFIFYIILAGIAVIVLSLLGLHDAAQPFAWSVCLLVFLYWLFYFILKRKY